MPTVQIEWVGRRLADLPDRARRRLRRRREHGPSSDWDWWLPGPVFADSLAAVLLGTLVAVLVVLLWEFVLGTLVLAVLEALLLLVLAATAVVWKALLRRPWRVVVRDADGVVREQLDVVGFTAARRVRDDLRRRLVQGPVDRARSATRVRR